MSLLEPYADRTKLRGVVLAVTAVIPYVGGLVAAADTVLLEKIERAQQERFAVLLAALDTGETELTKEVAESEPLLHACYITVEATLRTHRREKIRWFARLLLAGVDDRIQLDLLNEHEDYLKILDELSYRELGVLATLAEFEAKHPKREEDDGLGRANQVWDEFSRTACRRFSIPEEEFPGVMERLNRTGTYQTFVGAYYDYGGDRGKLTATYFRLASLLQLRSEEFDIGSPLGGGGGR